MEEALAETRRVERDVIVKKKKVGGATFNISRRILFTTRVERLFLGDGFAGILSGLPGEVTRRLCLR